MPFQKSIWIECVCANCAKRFLVKPSSAARRVTCSRECSAAVRSRRTKGIQLHDAHPAWNGGVAPGYYRQFLKGACERCGATHKLLIHHRDRNRNNSDPANLETLCPACHGREHREERSILTRHDVDLIRSLYAAGGVTQKALGERFGVSRGMIGHIVRGKAWAHVD